MNKEDIKEGLKDVIISLSTHRSNFICTAINNTYPIINRSELLNFFESNKPTETLHEEFFEHINFNGGFSWWTPNGKMRNLTAEEYKKELENCRGQRILFLEYLIETL